MIRLKLDEIEKAAREGTLNDYLEQHGGKEFFELLRGKSRQVRPAPVLHVTDVSPGTGEATSVDLCEEHAGDLQRRG